MTIWHMLIACWVPKATDTHSECVTLIVFSTATMVARTPLSVRIHVHCLPCLIYCLIHHNQYTLVTHADDLLCLEMHTVGSRSQPPPPVLKCSFDSASSDEVHSSSICVVCLICEFSMALGALQRWEVDSSLFSAAFAFLRTAYKSRLVRLYLCTHIKTRELPNGCGGNCK